MLLRFRCFQRRYIGYGADVSTNLPGFAHLSLCAMARSFVRLLTACCLLIALYEPLCALSMMLGIDLALTRRSIETSAAYVV